MHTEIPAPEIKAKRNSLLLEFDEQWLNEHPLIYADLTAEQQRLTDIDFKLKIKQVA